MIARPASRSPATDASFVIEKSTSAVLPVPMPKRRRKSDKVARFSVSLPQSLLDELDEMVASRGYQSRSQAVAALAREGLVEYASQLGTTSVAGTINLVYDHRKPGLQARLAAIQHKYFILVVTSMHVHLENHNYLEVLLVQGPADELRKLADELVTCSGVKNGRLSLTASAMPPLK
ncbi:nickel-responsive transcriptional regulator NikR [Opitutales bacterium ASA1]|nr:nickel-responsive transcriptional regulator NikR [Opitutales bacterium ASA1]